MEKPCAVRWCVALADRKDSNYCAVHRRIPELHPQLKSPDPKEWSHDDV